MEITVELLCSVWEATTGRLTIGCTQKEISTLEGHFSISLPKEYKTFLQHIGKCAGGLMDDASFEYAHLFGMRVIAYHILLAEANPSNFSLPHHAFVFFQRQEEQFAYFECNGRDENPPVFEYVGGDGHPAQRWPSFTAWLWCMMAGPSGDRIKIPEEMNETWLDKIKPGWDFFRKE